MAGRREVRSPHCGREDLGRIGVVLRSEQLAHGVVEAAPVNSATHNRARSEAVTLCRGSTSAKKIAKVRPQPPRRPRSEQKARWLAARSLCGGGGRIVTREAAVTVQRASLAAVGAALLLLEAALTHDQASPRLSFKGAIDAIIAWTALALHSRAHQLRARRALLHRIAGDAVPLRPGRSEPRVRKRRPKNYQLMTRPRAQMRVSASRNLK